ncbi:hypothetical protein HY490_04210 [Candidatus Woesearchaeota archaeon]|nr:hypothetical protein [Candidatus Woesearchaeota archaeon]
MGDINDKVHGELQAMANEFKAWDRYQRDVMNKDANRRLEFTVTSFSYQTCQLDCTAIRERDSNVRVCDTGILDYSRFYTPYACPKDNIYQNPRQGLILAVPEDRVRAVWRALKNIIAMEETENRTVSITGLAYFNGFYRPNRRGRKVDSARLIAKRIRTYCTHDNHNGSPEFLALFEP